MNTKHALSMSLVCAFSAVVSIASADSKVIPGAACMPNDPADNDVTVTSDGITANANVSVYCPLVRDTTNGLASVVIGFHSVYADEVIGNENWSEGWVTCTLYARDTHGDTSDSVTETFFFTGTYLAHLSGLGTFSSTSLNNLTDGTDRAFTIKCSLQDGDGIGGIEWDE